MIARQLNLYKTLCTETKLAEFENSIDPIEVAHNEPPQLDLHCLVSSLWILNLI